MHTVTPCPRQSGFQNIPCPVCESNTRYKISNYRHSILSPRRSEASNASSLPDLFFCLESPCQTATFHSVRSRRFICSPPDERKMLHVLAVQAIHFQYLHVHTPTIPACCLKRPRGISQVLAKPPRCFSNKNLYNFKECWDNGSLDASGAFSLRLYIKPAEQWVPDSDVKCWNYEMQMPFGKREVWWIHIQMFAKLNSLACVCSRVLARNFRLPELVKTLTSISKAIKWLKAKDHKTLIYPVYSGY